MISNVKQATPQIPYLNLECGLVKTPQIEEFLLKYENFIVSSSHKEELIVLLFRCFDQIGNHEELI